jgi:Baseplate J-like protein
VPAHAQLLCDDRARRRLLLADPALNGIDAVEVPFDDQEHPRVFFVKEDQLPSLTPSQVRVEGGVRVRDIAVVDLDARTDDGVPYLELTVDRAGDFSVYTLVVDAPGELDPAFSRQPFSFKAGCPSDLDCAVEPDCPVETVAPPAIDYLAKDYASFQQLLLDLATARVPGWTERHEADLGVALVELLAYVADDLSYYQDAVANEAFLETARQRESVRRHAKLIDYPMHEGANASGFVHLTVASAGAVPAGTVVASRITTPVTPGASAPPGPVIAAADADRAIAAADAVFQVVQGCRVDPRENELAIHTWGDAGCCLPTGATEVDLVGKVSLAPGDLLLLEEVRGQATGLHEDADPEHRQVVRLTRVDHLEDPLLAMGYRGPRPRRKYDRSLPVTRVRWSEADALGFPLCVSTVLPEGTALTGVSVARGNVLLADHGRTVEDEDHPIVAPGPGGVASRVRLRQGPLTFRATRPALPGDPPPDDSVASLVGRSPHGAESQVTLDVVTPTGTQPGWRPVPDLLDSDSFAREFVVEMGRDGRALLRFGDDEFGQAPPGGATARVTYRVGNGAAGNVGQEALAHVVTPVPIPDRWPEITGVRNPLPAFGGVDPEAIEQVRRLAPAAFHAELYRAVTEADYARAAEKLPEVSRATATFRWTGSWYTVFVAVDPRGRDRLDDDLQDRVRAFLTRYQQTGYDLEIDPPVFVPLEIGIRVCVDPDHFRADVRRAVADALSNRRLPDGRLGFFHPDNFSFREAVYLSRLYAAVEAVEGVDSAEVVTFNRLGRPPAGELEAARIEMARLEVARLDNDPNVPEHGLLTLTMLGGK